MQTLQNLTLITITKNRPESLLHMLKYYDGSGVNFVICDASKKKIKKKNYILILILATITYQTIAGKIELFLLLRELIQSM